ncbi:MAG: hypothetical protein WCG27_11475 [Pseudomonadota bacterium]
MRWIYLLENLWGVTLSCCRPKEVFSSLAFDIYWGFILLAMGLAYAYLYPSKKGPAKTISGPKNRGLWLMAS